MRISDWSSDVGSSDLDEAGDDWAAKVAAIVRKQSPTSLKVTFAQIEKGATLDFDQAMIQEYRLSQAFMAGKDFYEGIRALLVDKDNRPRRSPRSDEHPSELQSLMRIQYAAFCLKKK